MFIHVWQAVYRKTCGGDLGQEYLKEYLEVRFQLIFVVWPLLPNCLSPLIFPISLFSKLLKPSFKFLQLASPEN